MVLNLPDGLCTLKRVRVLFRWRVNKTRQGYARMRTLKPAGYFFVDEVG